MDKSTNVHQKVAATFISTYYNAIAEGKTADISKMYLPNAKVNHCGADGAAALAAYAKGARVVVSDMEARLVDNTHLKVFVKGSIVVGTEQKKDFQHDVDLVHHNTSANQLAFGVEADFLRIITAVPPPPKMKFDDWAADTPQLAAQSEGEAEVPSMDLIASKGTTPSVTPKVAPTPAPVAPAPVEQQVEEVKPVEEKKEVAAPVVATTEVVKPAAAETSAPAAAPVSEAPKGWASIVRSDKPQGAKTVVSVVDPTKKVAPVVEKKVEEVEKKVEKKEKKEEEEKPKERRSNKNSTPIFYDIFVKGFPEGTTEATVPTTLGLTVAVANTKIDTKEDKSGVRRVFVYIKLSAEDLAKQNITREDAIATIIANNKGTKVGTSRLSVEEVKEKERYHADNSAAKSKK